MSRMITSAEEQLLANLSDALEYKKVVQKISALIEEYNSDDLSEASDYMEYISQLIK